MFRHVIKARYTMNENVSNFHPNSIPNHVFENPIDNFRSKRGSKNDRMLILETDHGDHGLIVASQSIFSLCGSHKSHVEGKDLKHAFQLCLQAR